MINRSESHFQSNEAENAEAESIEVDPAVGVEMDLSQLGPIESILVAFAVLGIYLLIVGSKKPK